MPGELSRTTVNGATLGYSVHGAGMGKRPLLFAHGHSMRSTQGPYEELFGLLAQRYAVYALDLRGHGASADAITDWSLATLAQDLVGFVGALDLDRPVFVGHSFGAILGTFTEIYHPGTFSALCLLAPGPADPRRDPVEALDFLIEHGRNRDLLLAGLGHMFVRSPDPAMLTLVVDATTVVHPQVHRALSQQNATVSIDDQLTDVQVPTLVVCGGRDNVVSPARQHDLASKLPYTKQVVFSAEGHMLPIENAATTAREVVGFLDHDANRMQPHGGDDLPSPAQA